MIAPKEPLKGTVQAALAVSLFKTEFHHRPYHSEIFI